jgi:hypothetical protein
LFNGQRDLSKKTKGQGLSFRDYSSFILDVEDAVEEKILPLRNPVCETYSLATSLEESFILSFHNVHQ